MKRIACTEEFNRLTFGPAWPEVGRVLHCFNRSFNVEFVPRDFEGYFSTEPAVRRVSGKTPENLPTFVFYLLYATMVVFQNPTLEQSFAFVKFILLFHEADAFEAVRVLEDINRFAQHP